MQFLGVVKHTFELDFRRFCAHLLHVHVHIDNKAFKVPTNDKARASLAAKAVVGTYRTSGKSLERAHVKASPKMRTNTGARSIMIAGGVGAGRVLLWHAVEKQWCAEEADKMYPGPLLKALQQQYPGKRKFNVLEDNDPAGYQSAAAKTAKKEAGLEQFAFASALALGSRGKDDAAPGS